MHSMDVREHLYQTSLREEGFGKQLEKEKMLVARIFSFSNCVFYYIIERNYSNIWFVIWKCFDFGLLSKFSVC